jgi:hypothetical protein
MAATFPARERSLVGFVFPMFHFTPHVPDKLQLVGENV